MSSSRTDPCDVFLSYCGKDTSDSFTSDLSTALINAGVSVFREDDNKLRSEEQLPLSVHDAIEASRISIVVFSRNYADSRRHLQELEKIVECQRTKGQVVLPVFYGVDSSLIDNQTGLFREAYAELWQRFLPENWTESPMEASNIPGFVVMDSSDESKVMKEAVAHVTNMLDLQPQKDMFVAKHPVGLEPQVQHMIHLLNENQHTKNDIILLGICGMGGAGKTTFAKAVYNKISRNFEAKSFLSIAGEAREKRYGLVSLRRRLLSDLCKIRSTITRGKELSLVERRLRQKRILLVLDDDVLSDTEELNALCGNREWYGSGSRIIITSRDSYTLKMLGVSHRYEMRLMANRESLELFSWHAFKQECPPDDYVEMSRKAIRCAKGMPLLLEVLGSFLSSRSREKSEWMAVLEKLEAVDGFTNILKILYDELSPELQSMFLEITSFFVGMNQDEVTLALSNSGYSAEFGLTTLEACSLITINEDNLLTMHSLLLAMGQEIIRSESRAKPEEPKVYEVFLSFRGEDTRGTFISHLQASLQDAGLHVFKDDDEMETGERISVSLLQAIGRSRIAVVVLSKNYAKSRWCMMELENIMENCQSRDMDVVPVFYNVDPSEVRKQTGDFGIGFENLKKRISADSYKEESWKNVLLDVGGRKGFVLINSKNENEDIKKVVGEVTDLLGKTELFVAKHPVGVDSRVKDVVQLLNCQQSDKVLLLAIWGMGGIGKTTIAKAIYNEVRRNFEAKSFLLNVREVCKQNNGLVSLQQRLLSDVYKTIKIKINTVDSGIKELEYRLGKKKIFLVLDDVNELEQLNGLFGSHAWFRQGSRIIITTRDEDLFRSLKVDCVYRMKEMGEKESLELFSWHAFEQARPSEGFAELSRDAVKYCGGLPLALQVIGSFLFNREITVWKSALEKLKVIPNDEVLTKLKISFDGLKDDDVKEIFLDIAFFFIGMDRDDVIEILKDCGHFAEIGISVLVQQTLVTVDNKNRIRMHDLLRDMGREIVRKKSKEESQELSRLWRYQDLEDELLKDTRMKTLKGLTLTKDTPTRMETKDFEKMKNLKLLQLAGIKLDGDYKHLSKHIRWLCWHEFPERYTPPDFDQGSLVAIELKYSKHLEQVWKKSKMLNKLKLLNLSHSCTLRETPDFSKLPNLEKLILKDCPNLASISRTIGDLSAILLINLKNCTNLHTLPRSIYKLTSLRTLILSGCSKIDKLEEDIQQMTALTTLVADNTAITKVPFAVVRSKSIAYINLCGFEGLSRNVFPSLVWSWMSPTNSVLPAVQTNATMSSLVSLHEQGSCFHGLSSVIKDLQELQRVWVKCDSELQLNQTIERILDTLNTNCEESEATPSTSSTIVDCGIHLPKSSSKKFLTSLLFQMGMNCQNTSVLKDRVFQQLSGIGPGRLPGHDYPNWLSFNCEGSAVSFEVPEVNGRDLKTIMCVVNFSSPDNLTSQGLQNVLVINYTKTTFQIYKRDGLASLEEEDEWQNVISNIEPGDKVKVVVVLGAKFTAKEIAVYFIYDEPTDKNDIASGGDENRIGRLFFTLPPLVQAILISRPFMWFGLIGILVWSSFRLYKRRSCNLFSRYAILTWKWLVNNTKKRIPYKKANKSAQCN